MSRLLVILILFVAMAASAAERITLTITVTNPPVTGNTLTVAGSTRTWTNATTSTTILTNSTVNNSATNLFLHIAATPLGSPRFILQWSDTNVIKLIGQVGQAVSGSSAGTWATLSLSTQSGPQTVNAVYPFANITGDTNRTNQASQFVSGMSTYATNSFATNATALSNHMTLGIAPGGITQTAQTAKVFWNMQGTNGGTIYSGAFDGQRITNATGLHGTVQRLTNGVYITPILVSITTTNGTNFGNAFSSQGSNAGSEQFGAGATAAEHGTAVGAIAEASTNAVAIGYDAVASGRGSIAIGETANAGHAGSIVIGNGSAGTTNELVLGGSTMIVKVGGRIDSATTTNLTVKGTNQIHGRLEYQAVVNANLANGNNTGLLLGTNVYVRLVGSSAATTNGGFLAEPGGSFHIVQITNPVPPVVIVNDALDGTAANRILTGTGADLLLTNNPVMLQIIYDGAASRWRVISPTRSQ